MNMQNYKILVIILLAISITVVTSISYAQISEQIPSPKKQLDNGIAPHDVICRDELVLVDRGADKIACIKETSIKNTHWNLIENPYSELIDSKIKNPVQNTSLKNSINDKTSSSKIMKSFSTAPSFHRETGFFSTTFPNSVLVNETFVLEYTWMRNMSDDADRYFESCNNIQKNTICDDTSNMSNVALIVSPDLEFVDTMQTSRPAKCYKYITGHINSESINDQDRTGNFSLKFTKIPDQYSRLSMLLFFVDTSIALFNTTNSENNIININEIYPEQINFSDPCDTAPTPNVNNTTQNTPSHKVVTTQNTMIDPIPSCIHEKLWNLLSQNEKNIVMSNQTTCQLVDGKYIMNLPPIGYRIIPETAFPTIAKAIDAVNHTDPRSFVSNFMPDDDWIDDFVNYYNNISKQSYDFFFFR